MTGRQMAAATEELRKLCNNDKAFMDLVGTVGLTVITYPAFKAFLAAKARPAKAKE
jgi:hypothetical protein